MHLVVDASVVLKWAIAEPGHERAREILEKFVFGETHLIAPRTLPDEIYSALTKRVRMKLMSVGEAQLACAHIQRYSPAVLEGAHFAGSAFDLSLEHQVNYWDALYLALAIEYRCDLVTADARFYRSAVKHYPYVRLLGR